MTPGSKTATDRGCTCPVMDNSHGKGHLGNGEKYGYWITAACPIHGNPLETGKNNEQTLHQTHA